MPSKTALLKWWQAERDANPGKIYTCADCGRQDSAAYVQPQHPDYADGQTGIARCADCIGKINQSKRQQRKEARDAEPRCEACNKGRVAFKSCGALLCGRCFKRANAAHSHNMAGAGWLAMFESPCYTKEQILNLAKGAK